MLNFFKTILLFLIPIFSLFSNIGQQEVRLKDEDRNRPIEMMVWYPTKSKELTNEGTVWMQPDVAINGILEEKKHPLIILSHGWGGEKIELIWLAEKLVEQGYIVAAIDHYGNTWKDYSEEISLDFSHRPKDISAALDHLTKDSPFSDFIDLERIGFSGFSMGGLTGLWLAGGEIENVSYKDPRIRAFFLMAPRGKDFSETSLQTISAPLSIVFGEEDKILPVESHGMYINRYTPKSILTILKGPVGHPIFLNCPTDMGKTHLAKEIVEDHLSIDRSEMHEQISSMAINFFSENL